MFFEGIRCAVLLNVFYGKTPKVAGVYLFSYVRSAVIHYVQMNIFSIAYPTYF